jgi:molybdate transport system ATP-binding protein
MADEIAIDIERRFPAGPVIRAAFRLGLTAGSTTILFGPSGAGKTTVLRAIAGLEPPDRGVIRFGDEVWLDTSQRRNLPPDLRKVGLLFQDYALFPHLTIRQNIDYGLHHHAKTDRRRICDEMMQLFEITELADRRPREISGGQAQRVALARAVAPRPRILLLDEPLGALDVPTRTRVRTELRRLLERVQIPSLLVTHDRAEAITLGRQIVVMSEGTVRQIGPVDEVFRRPADATVALAVGVESILNGVIAGLQDGLAKIHVGLFEVTAVAPEDCREGQRVLVCIRAEDVTLQPVGPRAESARNHLAGRIEAVESDGAVERVTVDCGFRVVAMITRNAREELRLAAGDAIVASVKATAVHLIPL